MALNFATYTYTSPGSTLATNSGDDLFFKFKTFMKTAGWTVPQSSDGTTLNQSGTDQISSAGSGTGGMANASSWFILKEPGSFVSQQRQFLFYKGSTFSSPTDGGYRNIQYSVQGFQTGTGFNSTAVTATNIPIAYDGLLTQYAGQNSQSPSLWSGSLPANNLGNQFIPYLSDGALNLNMPFITYVFCASTTAPYFWYILGYTKGAVSNNLSAVPVSFYCYDPMGNYDGSDPDPVVIHNTGMTTAGTYFMPTNFNNVGGNSSGSAWGRYLWHNWSNFTSKTDATNKISTAHTSYMSYDVGGNGFTYTTYNTYLTSSPYQYISSPSTAKVPLMNTSYNYYNVVAGTNYLIKGTSKYIYTPMTALVPFTLLSVNNSKDYIAMGGDRTGSSIVIPWNQSSVTF